MNTMLVFEVAYLLQLQIKFSKGNKIVYLDFIEIVICVSFELRTLNFVPWCEMRHA